MATAPQRARLSPITLREANSFVFRHHRHSDPTQGHRFSVAVTFNRQIVGVGIAGRPVSKALDDGSTIEITRVCTSGEKNVCSMLYGALCRAAAALGYRRAITYTLTTEPGTSLKASGFEVKAIIMGRSWDRPRRARQDSHVADRHRWERVLNG